MSVPAWQEEYDRELRRTAGYGVTFTPISQRGGWWRAHYESAVPRQRSVQCPQVVRWTDNLRKRPDFVPDDAEDDF